MRTVVVYRGGGREMPILETRHVGTVALVALRALREMAAGVNRCDDPVLAELIRGEADQARRALRAAGVDVSDVAK